MTITKQKQEEIIEKIRFDNRGLIPAIIQSNTTQEVLMLGYMNEEALQRTFESKKVHFWSRKRKKLWMKGETSGNIAFIESVALDCDRDTLLVKVAQTGPICHLGTGTCFVEKLNGADNCARINFEQLFEIITDRIKNPASSSYVNNMINKGNETIIRKLGEEAIELIIASQGEKPQEIIHEAADLFFHSLLYLAANNYSLDEIYAELGRRHKSKTQQMKASEEQ